MSAFLRHQGRIGCCHRTRTPAGGWRVTRHCVGCCSGGAGPKGDAVAAKPHPCFRGAAATLVPSVGGARAQYMARGMPATLAFHATPQRCSRYRQVRDHADHVSAGACTPSTRSSWGRR